MRRQGLVMVAAAAVVAVSLTACTGAPAETEPTASSTTGAVTSSAVSTPSATAAASAEPTASPTPEFATDPAYSVEPPATGEAPATVEVQVTRWTTEETVQAGAVIDGVAETGGTCTLTLTRSGVVHSATGPGAPSATSTNCGEDLSIDAAALDAGTWTLVIAYASERFEGASTPKEITIP